MRRLAVVLSIVVVAAAFVVTYTAQTSASQEQADTGASGFVGSWSVEVSIPGQGGYAGLATYMADGTTIHSRTLAQPTQQGGILLISPAHGVWEASSDREIGTTFVGLNTDDQGNFLGSASISGTQRLSPDGQSYTGEYVVTIMDPTGAVVASIPGTAAAVRINVESATVPGTPAASPAA
jgi:hypothetical protein